MTDHGVRDDTGLSKPPAELWRRWWESLAPDSALASHARAHGWVVTTAAARELGMSMNDIRREVRRGAVWPPVRGVVTPVDVTDSSVPLVARRRHALRATGCAALRTDHVVEGRSAAILHGLPTAQVPLHPELAGPQTAGRRGSVLSRAIRIRPPELTTWFGCGVTMPAGTIVDLARRSGDDGIMAADAGLRSGIVTMAALQNATIGCAGWPGARRAREIVAIASPKSESPLESVTRLRLHDDEFPPPSLQVELGGFRVDLCWPEFGV